MAEFSLCGVDTRDLVIFGKWKREETIADVQETRRGREVVAEERGVARARYEKKGDFPLAFDVEEDREDRENLQELCGPNG
jgi:hypothetical protein